MNKIIPLSISLIFSVLSVALAQQNILLKGSVVVQNSKMNTGKVEYLADVAIDASFSTPTTSDNRGQFSLLFSSVPVGNKVSINAERTGMKVVNAKVLDEASVLGRTEALKIVMCKTADFYACQTKYYNISHDVLEKNYERRLAILKKSTANDKKQLIDSLSREMSRTIQDSEEAKTVLSEQKKNLETQISKLSRQLALVNLDDESETYQRAFTAFTEGSYQQTIEILNAVDLEKRLRENTTQIVQRDSGIKRLTQQNDTSRQQIGQDIRSALLKATTYKFQYNIQEAQHWYTVAITYDSLNFALLNEFTSYVYELGDFDLADSVNQLVLNRTDSLRQTADSARYTEGYAFGLYYHALLKARSSRDHKSTQETCLEAIPLFTVLLETDTSKRIYQGRLMLELAQSYSKEKKDSLAIAWYRRALAAYAQPVSVFEQREYYLYKSMVYDGLGNTFRYLKQLDSAETHCLMSVNIKRQLFIQDTFRYAPYLGLSLNMLASVYSQNQQYDKAIDTLRQAIRYCSMTEQVNPRFSRVEHIRAETNLAYVFSRRGAIDSAVAVLDRVQAQIAYFKAHFSVEWIAIQVQVFAIERRRLVSQYIKKNDLVKAFQISQKTFELASNEDVAITTLAVVYLLKNEYAEAVRLLEPLRTAKEELKIYLHYFENNNITHPDFRRIKSEFGL